jgi:glycosyltransferase involved in cell wall biosynthesis
MIVRDDASTLRACLESVRPHVDELVIVDTGSTDDSEKIAREFADKWERFEGCNEAGLIVDFAAARNRSLGLVENPWFFWIDGDDVLVGGESLRKLADEAPRAERVLYSAFYEYEQDGAGKVTQLQERERLMYPSKRFEWEGPVHETCAPKQPIPLSTVLIPTKEFRLQHRTRLSTKQREAGRNLRILKHWAEKKGLGDLRSLYYLGVESKNVGAYGDALFYLKRYERMTNVDEERYSALMEITSIYRAMGSHEDAIFWANEAMNARAFNEAPFALGRSYYALARLDQGKRDYNYRRAAHWFRYGLSLRQGPRDSEVILKGKAFTHTFGRRLLTYDPLEAVKAHEYLSVCLAETGDLRGAIESCEAAIAGGHDTEDIQTNLKSYQATWKRTMVSALTQELSESGDIDESAAMVINEALAGNMRIDAGLQTSAGQRAQMPDPPELAKAEPGKLRIALFTGPAPELWNPETLQANGMGGSETMAWEIAKRLAKVGNGVNVFGYCSPDMEGIFEGVVWCDWSRFHDMEFDVLISSRVPEVVDDNWNVRAKVNILWMHDVHCGEKFTEAREKRYDRIICLSDWHKGFFLETYPKTAPDKIEIIRNGIDLARFANADKVERHPHRAFYSSSPDRGLELAVDEWPKIREYFPDAELHVFYGFLNWEEGARGRPDELKKIRALKEKLENTEGVVMRDRVNGAQLAKEMLASHVWCYPTWFSETSCITAMEARAAGCWIVTSPIAALVETAKAGNFINGEYGTSHYRNNFVELMRVAFTRVGRTGYFDTEENSLDNRAGHWRALLSELFESTTKNVMPAFHEVAAQ